MVETIWRPKRPSALTDSQRADKLQRDSQYELAAQNLSTAFYQKKRSVGVTPQEEEAYRQAKSKLWNDYLEWAKANGLYQEVTPEQQLAEAQTNLTEQINQVNLIRSELGQKPIQIIEVA